MKNPQTKQTLLHMRKMIAILRIELEILAEKVDKSLKKEKRPGKRIKTK